MSIRMDRVASRWCRKACVAAAALLAVTFSSRLPASSLQTDRVIDEIRSSLLTDPSEAFAQAERLKQKTLSSGDAISPVIIGRIDWIRAAALVGLGKPGQAIDIANRALRELDGVSGSPKLTGDLLTARARASSQVGQLQQALQDYQKAFYFLGLAHDARGQAIALQDIAATYSDANDFGTALRYTRQSIEVFSADPDVRLSGFNNAGVALQELGRFSEAEQNFYEALKAASELKSPRLQVQVLRNIAEIEEVRGRFREAERLIARATPLTIEPQAASWRAPLLVAKATIALDRGDIPKARKWISQALALTDRVKDSRPERTLHQTAYKIYKRSGEIAAALRELETYQNLDSRARALAASANAALMSAKFDFANQNLKIARLRQSQAEHEAILVRTRVVFHNRLAAAILAAAFIIISLLAIGYRSIVRSRNQIRSKNTDLVQLNERLAKALDAKSEFLATTSHEIRTPLNGILGMTQVLLADRAIDSSLKTRVEVIHGAGETMRALVDDILDMAKMETEELRLHPAAMDLHRLLRDTATVWSGQAETKRIGLNLILDEAPLGIVADEVRLRQIVFNLMANAIKFTDRGQVRLLAREAGKELIIRVEDSGIGIPADKLDEIFEAFRQVDGGVTRRHGGTGLGLAICRNLARAMDGDVTVTSVLGAGSVFTLTIPLARAELPEVQGPTAGDVAPATLSEARMLLIEPNPLSQGILRALLSPHVRRLSLAGDIDAAEPELAAGVDHIIADAAVFGGDPSRAKDFVDSSRATYITLLWPSPDRDVSALLSESGVGQVLAKPIAAPELLARLRMRYGEEPAHRELAA